MKNEELVKVLEKIRDQKIVAVTEAFFVLDTAIKLLSKYTDFCDVCWTSSWAPVPKDHPYAQKIKDKDEYVVCQMCEADRRLIKLSEDKKNKEVVEENKIAFREE